LRINSGVDYLRELQLVQQQHEEETFTMQTNMLMICRLDIAREASSSTMRSSSLHPHHHVPLALRQEIQGSQQRKISQPSPLWTDRSCRSLNSLYPEAAIELDLCLRLLDRHFWLRHGTRLPRMIISMLGSDQDPFGSLLLYPKILKKLISEQA